jgi:hypothetical protein
LQRNRKGRSGVTDEITPQQPGAKKAIPSNLSPKRFAGPGDDRRIRVIPAFLSLIAVARVFFQSCSDIAVEVLALRHQAVWT